MLRVCPYIVFPAVSIVESVHTIAITCSCHTNCLIKKILFHSSKRNELLFFNIFDTLCGLYLKMIMVKHLEYFDFNTDVR